MELLNLAVPKNRYLLDFLAEEDLQMRIQDSWILMHDSIVDQLLSKDGFKRKEGIKSSHILYRYTEKTTDEIVIDDETLSFRNWSAVIGIMNNKVWWYDAYTITPLPKYLTLLKMEK